MLLATLSDHVSNALVWLPAVFVFIVGSYILSGLFARAITPSLFPGDNSPSPRTIYNNRRFTLLFYIFVLSITLIGELIWWPSFKFFVIVIIFSLGLLILIFSSDALRGVIGEVAEVMLFVILLFSGFIMAIAHVSALNDIGNSTRGDLIILARDSEEIDAKLLRVYSGGILFKPLAADRVVFMRWEEIRGISETTVSLERRPLVCDFLRIGC